MYVFICAIILYLLIYLLEKFNILHKPGLVGGFDELGRRYSRKLGLSEEEVSLLNTLKILGQYAYSVDFCMEAMLKLYVEVVRKFPELKNQDTKTEESVFSYCSWQVHTKYTYRISHLPDLETLLPEIDQDIRNAIDILSNAIAPLTEKQEKDLNDDDSSRWKEQLRLLKEKRNQSNDNGAFYENALKLVSLNKSRPTHRSIFFQSHQFMADKDEALSCLFYIHYLSIQSDQKSGHRNMFNKDKKMLFKNEAQQNRFEQIIRDFRKNENLGQASLAIDELFRVQRRKIQLDPDAILDAEKEHDSVVDLLNGYLADDEDPTVKPEILPETDQIPKFSKNYQKELINLFVLNDYKLNQKEVDIFAEQKRIFRNQLVDTINENFYEQLEDILIEEEGDCFVMNIKYYQQIKENAF